MIDENAFGLLISYLNIEDEEYLGEREDFVTRYAAFAETVQKALAENPPAAAARAIDLGHAVYVEVLEADEPRELIGWLKQLRATLADREYQTAGILTFGSTWVAADGQPESVACGPITLRRASLPSEPLRRSLLAEARTHGDEEEGDAGWGPGLYLDVDAVEALGRKPKNAPTILHSGGARFFRAGS